MHDLKLTEHHVLQEITQAWKGRCIQLEPVNRVLSPWEKSPEKSKRNAGKLEKWRPSIHVALSAAC